MAEITISDAQTARPLALPYAPGWVDRVMDRIDQLPVPYWLFYVGLAAVLVSIAIMIQTASDTTEPFYPILLLMGGALPYVLGTMHHFDHLADDILRAFRPSLRVTDAEYANLRYRLTTLPARQTWAATGVGLLLGVVLFVTVTFPSQLQIFQMVDAPLSIQSVHAFTLVNFVFAGLGWYHTQHQLSVVSEIYDRHTNVDMFNLKPLYAFSILSARTALAYLLYPYALFAAVPFLFELDFALAILFMAMLMTVLVFVLPLLGVHRRLEAEKARLLLENARRLERSIAELHERIDAKTFEGMGELNSTLASLELERIVFSRISTWPWQPETVRGLIATLILPMVAWVGQWLLERAMA